MPDSAAHRAILQRAIAFAETDPRILGLALHYQQNNWNAEEMVLVTSAESFHRTAPHLKEIAASFGSLVLAYEPVGHTASRELICLFDDPVDRIDLIVMPLENLPLTYSTILCQKGKALTDLLAGQRTVPPHVDLQWMEDRFWVWLHSAANSLREGALFETLEQIGNLRSQILAPLVLCKNKQPTDQLAALEEKGGEDLGSLRATVPLYDARSCEISLREAAKLYVGLRETLAPDSLKRHQRAELAVMRHLHAVKENLGA